MSGEELPGEGQKPEEYKSRYAVHETLPVEKRPYTLSEAAIAQRRAAAQHSTGPITAEGKDASKKNAWKHGSYAATTALGMVGKPCVSTCRKYPCSLVDDGATKPGSHCHDKEFYVECLQKIQTGIQEKQYAGVHEIFGTTMAGAMAILKDVQDRLLSEGTILKNAKMNKDGALIGWEYSLHPALAILPKLLGELGISFDSLLLTPASIAKAAQGKEEGEKENAMTIIARTLEKMADAKGKQ